MTLDLWDSRIRVCGASEDVHMKGSLLLGTLKSKKLVAEAMLAIVRCIELSFDRLKGEWMNLGLC